MWTSGRIRIRRTLCPKMISPNWAAIVRFLKIIINASFDLLCRGIRLGVARPFQEIEFVDRLVCLSWCSITPSTCLMCFQSKGFCSSRPSSPLLMQHSQSLRSKKVCRRIIGPKQAGPKEFGEACFADRSNAPKAAANSFARQASECTFHQAHNFGVACKAGKRVAVNDRVGV